MAAASERVMTHQEFVAREAYGVYREVTEGCTFKYDSLTSDEQEAWEAAALRAIELSRPADSLVLEPQEERLLKYAIQTQAPDYVFDEQTMGTYLHTHMGLIAKMAKALKYEVE